MNNTDHIYNPIDDSLAERIRAFKAVYQTYLRTKESLKYLKNDKWSETLGTEEEVTSAHEISINGLNVASEAIHREELSIALERGLLTTEEENGIIRCQKELRLRNIRKTMNKKKSTAYKQNRF